VEFEPLRGRRVLAPPGHLGVKLSRGLWPVYRRLLAGYAPYLEGLPTLAERDFDGKRTVKLTPRQLDALNRAFEKAHQSPEPARQSVFEAQERAKTGLFKRLQYLS
jgi:hypothetical protein